MAANVMDACAMIAYLEDEKGADVVESLLVDPDRTCIAHAVNLAEVYKHYMKYKTVADAEAATNFLLVDIGIVPYFNMTSDFWKEVAKVWGHITSAIQIPYLEKCHTIAMADCFAIALAMLEKGTVVTSDEQFFFVRDSDICPVIFFRPPGTRYDYSRPKSG